MIPGCGHSFKAQRPFGLCGAGGVGWFVFHVSSFWSSSMKILLPTSAPVFFSLISLRQLGWLDRVRRTAIVFIIFSKHHPLAWRREMSKPWDIVPGISTDTLRLNPKRPIHDDQGRILGDSFSAFERSRQPGNRYLVAGFICVVLLAGAIGGGLGGGLAAQQRKSVTRWP